MSHVFGPVPSRRLGRSLGVDLVPFKTCSYDCIYCQLGRTTNKTIERREWVPLDEVVDELKEKLSTKPDYITLSGSGEPTLYSRMGELISRIKETTEVPVAILTNGSLLWDPAVRKELLNADLVIPSLDAGDPVMFEAVNRPEKGITFEEMLCGLIDFRRQFQGKYWLEVMLMAGHTGILTEVQKIAACVKKINPSRVQINTVTRPPTEDYAVTIQPERLNELAALFDPPAEIIADYRGVHAESDFQASKKNVLELLQRRPCSIDDIADGLGMHRNETIKYVEELETSGLLEKKSSSGKLFYSGKNQP